MKTSSLKKTFATGVALAALALVPALHAQVTVNIEGGSASSSVIYDRATNLYAGGSFTVSGSTSANVATFVGSSLNPNLSGYGTITLNINLNNGAINGLNALVNHAPGTGDTNYLGVGIVPTFVDSATSPEAVGIDSVANNFVDAPTYVVPLVYVRNTNYADVAAITNLTQRQAVELETTTNKAGFYGSTGTNAVYFVGRNKSSAVRTEIDQNIYFTGNIKTFTNNASGLPVLDGRADPGQSSASTEVTIVTALTNSIGTLAVQNIKSPLGAIAFEGVAYSVTNVINGSYPLWGTEHYYYIQQGFTGAPSSVNGQLAIVNAFYNSVTNATFQTNSNPVFGNNFITISSLRVATRAAGADGGTIVPLPNY